MQPRYAFFPAGFLAAGFLATGFFAGFFLAAAGFCDGGSGGQRDASRLIPNAGDAPPHMQGFIMQMGV